MHQNPANSIKKYPFVRLLIPFIIGIIAEWHLSIPFIVLAIGDGITVFFLIGFNLFLSPVRKFYWNWLRGTMILLIFAFTGMLITRQQNIQNSESWYGKNYSTGDYVIATISEPLVEKTNSYKTLAAVYEINKKDHWVVAKGNLLLYFKKDSAKPTLQYGSCIVFKKDIQPIQNSGNPAAFNYNRYCLFQNITGQVFLSNKDYKTLSLKNINGFQQLLYSIRSWALNVLRQNIHSQKDLGIAEALLIGYRNDLDKELVQAYSNTGVVHIIAISGLHIGIIYSSLLFFFSLFASSKAKKIIEPIFILTVIWIFTLVAGAAPSVLRSAVMFTCIVLGKILNKNGNIYNTLAVSAFIILVANPFYLWDVGFQLSYAAVAGIVLFFKPISNLLYFKNLFLQKLWQLSAVSLAAQVFTLPLVVYHFHQIPLLFLFSNLVAVPLSGVILLEELILFCFSWWHAAASFIGNVTALSVRAMNNFIEHIDKLPFSVWNGLHISILQLLLMFVVVILFSIWIFNKNQKTIVPCLICITLFFIIRDADIIYHKRQQKIIVYNVSERSSVDFISGLQCKYAGDPVVLTDATLNNYNIRSSRIRNRVYTNDNAIIPPINNYTIKADTLRILMLDDITLASYPKNKIKVNVLMLSKNCNQPAATLSKIFDCNDFVADASVPLWKSLKWKKDFEQLHLRFYSVAQQGAFILNF